MHSGFAPPGCGSENVAPVQQRKRLWRQARRAVRSDFYDAWICNQNVQISIAIAEKCDMKWGTLKFFSKASMIKRFNFKAAIAFCLSAFSLFAHAQLNIDISGVGSRLFPIAIAPFNHEDAALQKVSDIIRADLARSGHFTNIDAGPAPVPDAGPIDWSGWKIKGADAFVTGRVTRLANGRYALHFRLYDTVKQADLGGLSLTGPASALRMNAHRIADEICFRL